MKRSAPLKRTRMPKGRGHPIPAKVRKAVMDRAKGFCEVQTGEHWNPDRAWFRVMDVHHLVKRPRLHEPWACVGLCRRHHEMCEAPYSQGRLVFTGLAADGTPAPELIRSSYLGWRIEVRERKGSELLRVLAEGRIAL